jgi:hypothetical protein
MFDVVLLLYALCGMFTFWAMFTGGASVAEVDSPTPTAAAAASLAAGVVWPVLLLGVLQIWVLAVIGNLVAPRPA